MRSILSTLCLVALAAGPAAAAIDGYLLLTQRGAPVETDPTHSWVSILGFEQGITHSTEVGSTSTEGTTTGTPVTLRLGHDRSIARMMHGLATGQSFDLTIHLVRSGSKRSTVLISLDFREVLFSAINASGASGDELIAFDITFSYAKLIYNQSIPQDDGVSVDRTLQTTANFLENEFFQPVATTAIKVGDYGGGSAPPPRTDTDGDGIPDSWETTHDFDVESGGDALIDTDGDGFTNIEEYIAGTNPRSPSSFFRARTVISGTAPATIRLNWNARAGRTYEVLASPLPDQAFATVHSLTRDTDGPLSIEPPAGTGPFFRIRVTE